MPTPTEDRNPMAKDQDWLLVNCHLLTPYRPFFKYPVVWMVSTLARVRVKAIYFVEKNYVDTSTTPFLKNCHLSSRKILDIMIQLGWRDFTGFSPRIQQFSSRFRRELLNSLRESSNSCRMFSNSRRRIRRELLILQKITTNREKRKVNLVATENWTILCCDENSNSRWDENCPILCCDEICPILYNLENMYHAVRGVFFLYYELAMLW